MLVGAPVAHGIGMLSGLLLPLGRGQAIHLIDVWDPAVVLATMREAGLSGGSGATYFLTSLLEKLVRIPFIHQCEMRSDISFQRKTP